MNINFSLDGSESRNQLDALALLIAGLGGRVGPVVKQLTNELFNGEVRQEFEESGLIVDGDSTQINLSRALVAPAEPSLSTDSAGLPWDVRIHSESRATNQDGTWRKRRGVEAAQVEQVEAELRGSAAPLADPAPTVPAATASPVVAATTAPDVPPPPVVQTAPPPPPPAEPEASTATGRFKSLPEFVTFASGKGLTYQALADGAKQVGVDDFKAVTQRPDLWEAYCLVMGW